MAKLDPDAKVARLSIAEMQLVEIAAAVRQRARVLVLDEPNSAISRRESERLFDVVRQLRSEGVAVVYVSHRLSEVLDLADRITVMRDGRLVETLDNRNVTEDRLIHAMVGRDVVGARDSGGEGAAGRCESRPVGRRTLRRPGIDGISFSVRYGEILGVAGLPDSGKDELGAALFGLLRPARPVVIDGAKLRASDPKASIRAGMFFVPADRRGAGGFLTMNIAENIVAASLSKFSVAGLLRRGADQARSARPGRASARPDRQARRQARHAVGRQPAEDPSRSQSRHKSARARSCTSRRAGSTSVPRRKSMRSCAASLPRASRSS